MRKRKFADGGDIREGRNENIGDDTRARAMEYLRRQRESGQAAPSTTPDEEPPVRSKAPIKPTVDESPAETARLKAAAAAKAPSSPKSAGRAVSEGGYGDVPAYSRTRPAAAKPQGAMERMARKVMPNPSWPGKGPESSLPAVAGVGLPTAARGAGRVAGGLASAAGKGWKAGEAEKAAAAAKETAAAAAKRDALAKTTRRSIAEDRYAAQQALANSKRTNAAKKAAGRSERGSSSIERMEGEGNIPARPARSAKYTSSRSIRERSPEEELMQAEGGRYKRGGQVKKYAKGGGVSASRRADGIAARGKTRGKIY